jgi:hypothetical protein
LLKTVNQHEDQRAIYGRKGSYFEAEKIRKINQSHWTSIRHCNQNNLECPEKGRNYW